METCSLLLTVILVSLIWLWIPIILEYYLYGAWQLDLENMEGELVEAQEVDYLNLVDGGFNWTKLKRELVCLKKMWVKLLLQGLPQILTDSMH